MPRCLLNCFLRSPTRSYWYSTQGIETGVLHTLRYGVDGDWAPAVDFAGYVPLSYELPDAKRGTLLKPRTIASKVYPGGDVRLLDVHECGNRRGAWGSAHVWHDGAGCVEPADPFSLRMQVVTDHLVHTCAIPPMLHLLVNPSTGGAEGAGGRYGATMRGIQCDTFSDRYSHHIIDELTADAGEIVKLRPDAYTRGTAGLSSGSVCAFALAGFRPDQFSRVHSVFGSFVDINGGHVVPERVRREHKRNIRVCAKALKGRYDFRYGEGFHDAGQAALDLPESLTWLWRDDGPVGESAARISGADLEPPSMVNSSAKPHVTASRHSLLQAR